MDQFNLLCENKSPNGKLFYIPRFEKVDWKQIASLDVDKLKETSDWTLLQKNLKNVVFCNVDLEFPEADPNLRKLFQMAQVAVEFLANKQNAAAVTTEEYAKDLLSKKAELEAVLKEKCELEKKLKELKKEKKNVEHHAVNQSNTAFFKCPYCPKAFLNSDFLKSHLQRRHGEVPVLNSTLGLTNYPPLHQLIPTAPPVPHAPPVPTAPPISPSPEKTLDESIFKEQVEDLKRRLQTTEQCLHNERNIFARLLEKYESSNVSLQSSVQDEIQKIHEKLTQAEHPMEKNSNANKPSYSIAIQTEEPQAVNVIESSTQAVIEVIEPPIEIKESNASLPEPIITTEEIKAEANPIIEKSPAVSKKHTAKTKENKPVRQVPEPFQNPDVEQSKFQLRKLVQRALNDKLEELGLNQTDAEIPDSKFAHVMKKLKKERAKMGAKFKPYETLRAKFEQQISAKLKLGNPSSSKTSSGDVIKPKSKRKLFGQFRSQSKERGNLNLPMKSPENTPEKVALPNVYEESPVRKISTGRTAPESLEGPADVKSAPVIRGPIPVPRSRSIKMDAFEEKPLLMARDGEATGVVSSSVKSLAKNLESSFNNRTVKPPTNSVDLIPKTGGKKNDLSDDSFSLSSLDNILASLKNPTKTLTSTPKINRSVSWKEPLDTLARATGYESWDSD